MKGRVELVRRWSTNPKLREIADKPTSHFVFFATVVIVIGGLYYWKRKDSAKESK